MESSNRNHDFQTQLKQINFKTMNHNQVETLGYDNLFASKRVVIFSITMCSSVESFQHITNIDNLYHEFLANGIDDVYILDSDSLFSVPRIDKITKNVHGYFDNKEFVSLLGKITYPEYDSFDLARFWQYVVYIDNGIPVKLWSNAYKPNLSLRIRKSVEYQYRKIGPEIVLNYFKKSIDTD